MIVIFEVQCEPHFGEELERTAPTAADDVELLALGTLLDAVHVISKLVNAGVAISLEQLATAFTINQEGTLEHPLLGGRVEYIQRDP